MIKTAQGVLYIFYTREKVLNKSSWENKIWRMRASHGKPGTCDHHSHIHQSSNKSTCEKWASAFSSLCEWSEVAFDAQAGCPCPTSPLPSTSDGTALPAAGQPWLGAQIHRHSPPVWLWTSASPLWASVLIYKMQIIISCLQMGCYRN